MQYLWIVFIIIAYIVTWVVFVIKIIDEIDCCKRHYGKPIFTDYIEYIFSSDYVKGFLIIHAGILFVISLCMFFGGLNE